MSKSFQLLKSLIGHVEAYARQETHPSLKGFAKFLLSVTERYPELEEKSPGNSASGVMEAHGDDNATIAFHLSRLNRYAKYYIREALKGSQLITADDFGFLAGVIEKGSISKSELIAYNIHEVSAGMEVIRRLVRNGLIEEKVSEADRRVRLLTATDKGRQALFQVMPEMQKAGAIVSSQLSPEEKKHLVSMLRRLDHFHERVYQEVPNYDLEVITERYL